MRRAQAVHRMMLVAGVLVLASWPGRAAAAQELSFADRSPRFLYAARGGAAPVEIDASRSAVLRRVVTLKVERPTVGRLLAAIERQTGLTFAYSNEFPATRPVSLRADSISVGAALSVILFETGVDVVLSARGHVALVERRQTTVVQAGTIVGRVTDVKTGEGLAGADISLDGTRQRTSTDDDGRYWLTEVAAGSYTLSVRRIGYRRANRAVTVAEDAELTVDVGLEAVPTQLDEVVTTVTGEQRLRELGHVVGRINADSLVREAPVSNLSELLTGRVPGLQVFQNQGTVGGDVTLQVRSPNSINLSTEPIVIVDGVRYTSDAVELPFASIRRVESTSPLNDLNPNDIASIEVVKGPSAATLYGTDAANGVIVVTTKRGRPGPARWNAYAKATTTAIPEVRYPDIYWGWQTLGGVPSLNAPCPLRAAAGGFCTQDSVTVLPNSLNDPAFTVFGSKPRWEYGANVSGGRSDLQYYLSGDFEQATGPLQMPPGLVDSVADVRGSNGLAEEQLEPNAFTKANLRARMTAALSSRADVSVAGGYSHRATRTLALISPYRGAITTASPGRRHGLSDPFASTSTERVNRFFASANGQWRPAAWLLTRATVGLDLANSHRASLARRGESPLQFRTGAVGDDRARQVATTADLGLTATFRPSVRLSSRTSVGVQYVRTVSDVLASAGTNLPPGASTIGAAASVQTSQTYSETATLGSYVEQMVSLNDRLFLTGALRVDGASTFGQNYDATVYPKVSASWLVSEEPFVPQLPGVEELRLRYAFGASGQQPLPEWARPDYAIQSAVLDGAITNVFRVTTLGNPNLRPERVREHEFGLDASLLTGRMHLELTWFRRRTVDQLVNLALPPGLGSIYTNLGETSGRGFEAQLTTRLLNTRAVSWDVALQHSFQTTELIDLGGVPARYSSLGGWVEGYPLGARFMAEIVGYADANGDGIIAFEEVQIADTAVYVGQSFPPRSQTLSTVLGFFDRRLRISGLLERRSGFTEINELMVSQCQSFRCRAAVDPTTPFAEQAEAAIVQVGAPPSQRSATYRFIESGDFTRLREVAVTIDLPTSLSRALHLRSAMLSLQGRNLVLWTDFSGPDPESGFRSGLTSQARGIPQGRSWALRIDLGL